MDQYQKLKQAVSLINKETTLTIPKADKLSKSLLDVYNDYLFLWNELDSSVVAISLRNHEYEKVHLVPTDTPFFQVNQLLISPSGKWICISGKKGKLNAGSGFRDFMGSPEPHIALILHIIYSL